MWNTYLLHIEYFPVFNKMKETKGQDSVLLYIQESQMPLKKDPSISDQFEVGMEDCPKGQILSMIQ